MRGSIIGPTQIKRSRYFADGQTRAPGEFAGEFAAFFSFGSSINKFQP